MHNVTLGSQLQNVSQGLYPDGNTNNIVSMADWTPRASNRIGAPAAPQISRLVSQSGGAITFQAAVIPGRTYCIQYTGDLAAPSWTQLGANLTAAGPTLSVSDAPAGQPLRFYRLVLLQ
jgi:hypothetical protein